MAIDVHEDVTAPVTKALNAVSVRRGAKATFKYRVGDVQSKTAAVTIKITKGSRTVQTFKLGSRATNASLIYKPRIKLAKGKYTWTWTVYAKDLSGSSQASPAGKNKLTVK